MDFILGLGLLVCNQKTKTPETLIADVPGAGYSEPLKRERSEILLWAIGLVDLFADAATFCRSDFRPTGLGSGGNLGTSRRTHLAALLGCIKFFGR